MCCGAALISAKEGLINGQKRTFDVRLRSKLDICFQDMTLIFRNQTHWRYQNETTKRNLDGK